MRDGLLFAHARIDVRVSNMNRMEAPIKIATNASDDLMSPQGIQLQVDPHLHVLEHAGFVGESLWEGNLEPKRGRAEHPIPKTRLMRAPPRGHIRRSPEGRGGGDAGREWR